MGAYSLARFMEFSTYMPVQTHKQRKPVRDVIFSLLNTLARQPYQITRTRSYRTRCSVLAWFQSIGNLGNLLYQAVWSSVMVFVDFGRIASISTGWTLKVVDVSYTTKRVQDCALFVN